MSWVVIFLHGIAVGMAGPLPMAFPACQRAADPALAAVVARHAKEPDADPPEAWRAVCVAHRPIPIGVRP